MLGMPSQIFHRLQYVHSQYYLVPNVVSDHPDEKEENILYFYENSENL